jgi:uncharacterized protein (DUF433 family)
MSSSAPFDIGTLITCTPAVYGGRPCLAGTRFPVLQIAAYVRDGWSSERILDSHPHLEEAKVHAAIAYYLANRDAFHAELDVDVDEVRRQYEEELAAIRTKSG